MKNKKQMSVAKDNLKYVVTVAQMQKKVINKSNWKLIDKCKIVLAKFETFLEASAFSKKMCKTMYTAYNLKCNEKLSHDLYGSFHGWFDGAGLFYRIEEMEK